MTIECCDCPYRYRDFGEDHPYCHFEPLFENDLAPCEYPEDIPEDDYPEYDA